MEKLEIKHLAPYLPYGLKIFSTYSDKTEILLSCNKEMITLFGNYKTISSQYMYSECKPILRPLSDLTKEIEVNDSYLSELRKFNSTSEHIEYLCEYKGDLSLTNLEYNIIIKLLEWHFDIFGLIDNNLAININDEK